MAVSNLQVKLNKYHTTVKWSILKKANNKKKGIVKYPKHIEFYGRGCHRIYLFEL